MAKVLFVVVVQDKVPTQTLPRCPRHLSPEAGVPPFCRWLSLFPSSTRAKQLCSQTQILLVISGALRPQALSLSGFEFWELKARSRKAAGSIACMIRTGTTGYREMFITRVAKHNEVSHRPIWWELLSEIWESCSPCSLEFRAGSTAELW